MTRTERGETNKTLTKVSIPHKIRTIKVEFLDFTDGSRIVFSGVGSDSEF